MTAEFLEPHLDLLAEEYVLAQAWKKTASYIRYHNWYSDTLELDRTTANLPRFLAELAERLKDPKQWSNDPLRIVPAPKSQQWHVNSTNTQWEPVNSRETATNLRPLAHVSLKDQVAATAVMLCLADRVETAQGDPRSPIPIPDAHRQVISYGNRLFCDARKEQLHHRWGSGKLYRAYYDDYRTFLSRPEIYAASAPKIDGDRVLVVRSDLSRFYDRVRPALLAQKMRVAGRTDNDEAFFAFTDRLFNWTWNRKDSGEVSRSRKFGQRDK
jgi:hypothetical protein